MQNSLNGCHNSIESNINFCDKIVKNIGLINGLSFQNFPNQ